MWLEVKLSLALLTKLSSLHPSPGVELMDDRRQLASYGVATGSTVSCTLHLPSCPRDVPPETVTLSILTSMGRQPLSLDVHLASTLADVKRLLDPNGYPDGYFIGFRGMKRGRYV